MGATCHANAAHRRCGLLGAYDKGGTALLEGMVVRASSCLRQAASGPRSEAVRYGRFLANGKVTLDALLAGWGEQTALAAASRHVLAIQETSEINFRTTAERHRGLGEIGKGVGRGLLFIMALANKACPREGGDGAYRLGADGERWRLSARP
jgi:hypothetical protein